MNSALDVRTGGCQFRISLPERHLDQLSPGQSNAEQLIDTSGTASCRMFKDKPIERDLEMLRKTVLAIAASTGLVVQTLAVLPAWAAPPVETRVQSVLDNSARDGKFTFVVFTKGDTAATRAMVQTVKTGVASRPVTAFAVVDAGAASERELVAKYGLARAPMPVTVAIAPNGAVTGIFAKAINDEQLTASIVPPTMMRCMKSLQDKKIVFVCLTRESADQAETPSGVTQLSLDPQFANRIETVSMKVDDPAESRFVKQMEVNPNAVAGPYAVLIAPPGVLVGHFKEGATPEEIAAAIHKAGQCCDDPNCKHNHAKPSSSAQKPNPRRN